MEPEDRKRHGLLKRRQSPPSPGRDPSLSATNPSTSQPQRKNAPGHHSTRIEIDEDPETPFRTRCFTFIYNKADDTFCGRTCTSWMLIIIYSFVYTCFLATYTLLVLFGALWCIRLTTEFNAFEKMELLTYSEYGVGLSITPVSESNQPVIWYRKNSSQDYEKYVKSLDDLLVRKRKKRHTELGPCGKYPYGYDGNAPCVIIRINKNLGWAGKSLELNSSLAKVAPAEVRSWMKKDKKLWLHCEGFHSYDKEHIGLIRYFPHPPGFDPSMFPLGMENDFPLAALQISNFTMGVSLAVECKLWYANGPATVNFLLYVALNENTFSNRTNNG